MRLYQLVKSVRACPINHDERGRRPSLDGIEAGLLDVVNGDAVVV